MIKAVIGDLFASHARALVNPVNCDGVMGKGLAAEFKRRFPVLFDDYAHRCERKVVRLGQPYLYRDRSGVLVVNFPTKEHPRSSSRLGDIERGLDSLAAHLAEWGIESLALPALGSENGGLDWVDVGPLIYRKLHDQPTEVEVYAPPGTPPHQLTTAFLRAPDHAGVARDGRAAQDSNENRVALMEVLRDLQARPDAAPTGRTMFQKICYVLTAMGVPTGIEFRKASYGPFSPDVKSVLQHFANRNWLIEEERGRVMALRVGSQYETERDRFVTTIQEHQKKVAKTVDLFSRIRSTEQADEVVTVLFASREIKKGKRGINVTEQQIFDFIVDWKKSWNTGEKKTTLAATIRQLVVLGWMRAEISESMLPAV